VRNAIRIVQISDLHLLGDPGSCTNGVDSAAVLERVVPLVNALAPDLVVATGDLTDDGTPAAYHRLRQLLAPLRAPLRACPGNHDDRQAFREAFGFVADAPLRQSLAVAGVRLVLLDSTVPGHSAGRLPEDDLAWLEAECAAHPDTCTCVFLHHQPLPIYVRWLDAVGLQHPDGLLQLLARHPQVRVVAHGHVHQPRRWRYGAQLVASVPALAYQISPLSQEPQITQDPPGFRCLEICGNEVRDCLYFLDGRVVPEPAWNATPIYIR